MLFITILIFKSSNWFKNQASYFDESLIQVKHFPRPNWAVYHVHVFLISLSYFYQSMRPLISATGTHEQLNSSRLRTCSRNVRLIENTPSYFPFQSRRLILDEGWRGRIYQTNRHQLIIELYPLRCQIKKPPSGVGGWIAMEKRF